MLQALVHYSLHFVLPVIIAWVFFRTNWKVVAILFLATMFVDVDHLLADPIFSSNRCSIDYHPFHSYFAIAAYVFFLLFKKTRIIALGLMMHMITDFIDCMLTNSMS